MYIYISRYVVSSGFLAEGHTFVVRKVFALLLLFCLMGCFVVAVVSFLCCVCVFVCVVCL